MSTTGGRTGFKDRTGERFGMLTVLSRAENHVTPGGSVKSRWNCQCDCGGEITSNTNSLVSKQTVSCGCKTNPRKDYVGKVFGRLTVLSRAADIPRPSGKVIQAWNCLCECGKETTVRAVGMLNGNTKSCGCLRAEVSRQSCTIHGLKSRPEYIVWKGMRQRCNDSNSDNYAYYGGRGIRIDPRWDSFEQFFADMGPRPEGLTIERVDNNGNYCVENCIWADMSTQSLNQRPRGSCNPNKSTETINHSA